jgi:hypothetical protein
MALGQLTRSNEVIVEATRTYCRAISVVNEQINSSSPEQQAIVAMGIVLLGLFEVSDTRVAKRPEQIRPRPSGPMRAVVGKLGSLTSGALVCCSRSSRRSSCSRRKACACSCKSGVRW